LQLRVYGDSLELLGSALWLLDTELSGKLALEGCSPLDKEISSELELAGGCSSSLLED